MTFHCLKSSFSKDFSYNHYIALLLMDFALSGLKIITPHIPGAMPRASDHALSGLAK